MGNPIDDYLEHGTEKKANFLGAMRSSASAAFSKPEISKLLWQTGAVAGVSALMGAARKAYDASTKSTDFRAMLDMNPDLAESHMNDPKMFNQYYSSLRRLNPTFASDPVVAGGYLRKMTEFPTNAGSILVDAAGASPKLPSSRIKDLSSGLAIANLAAPPSEQERMRYQLDRMKYEQQIQGRGGAPDEEE